MVCAALQFTEPAAWPNLATLHLNGVGTLGRDTTNYRSAIDLSHLGNLCPLSCLQTAAGLLLLPRAAAGHSNQKFFSP